MKNYLMILSLWAIASNMNAQVELKSSVLGSGATLSSNASVQLKATVAQIVIGKTSNSSLSNSQGFWSSVSKQITYTDNQSELKFASFRILQNPVIDEAMLLVQIEESMELIIKIFDMSGRELLTIPPTQYASGINRIALQTVDFDAGKYVVGITGSGFTESVRFIKL